MAKKMGGLGKGLGAIFIAVSYTHLDVYKRQEELIQAIASLAGTDALNPSEGILSNERQRANVSAALRSVREAKAAIETGMTFDAVTVSLEDAISELLEMTGERTSDEVIDRVFHNFCVGK